MRTRQLGKSDLQVSEVGLGCNNFGMTIDADQSRLVVDAAIAAGINFFDTADIYGGSESEVYLGQALGKRRKEVIVATKFGMAVQGDKARSGGSRAWILRAVEDSLKRLGTDYIDLYQFHTPDEATPIEETLRALDDLVSQGKVRFIGHSNFSHAQIAQADDLAEREGLAKFVSAQNQLSLIDRREETGALPGCAHYGLGFLPYFPLASGLLSGKYQRGVAPAEGTRMQKWGGKGLSDKNFDKVERLTAYAEGEGHTILELAFAWLLAHPEVSSVIAGATRPEQVAANAAAADWLLTPDQVNAVSQLAG